MTYSAFLFRCLPVRTGLPSHPWGHLAADFMGPLPSGHHLFAVVDYYSRWVEIAIMTTTLNEEKMVEALEKMFIFRILSKFSSLNEQF
jgi:hypothetical protein